jgi:hypothetical protein
MGEPMEVKATPKATLTMVVTRNDGSTETVVVPAEVTMTEEEADNG